MNLVTLPALKKLRYALDDSVKLPKLQRWAREGKLPGAFKPTPSSDWQVDLEEFDAAMREAKLQTAPEKARENRLQQLVLEHLRGHLQ